MGTVRPGEALLLARNCHLSAFSACVLSDAVPVWLQPEQDPMHGIAHCVTPEQLQQGFQEARQQGLKVGAVLVVSPTYYGAVARIPGALACGIAGGALR
jgi:arginine/lysine/ornithine decarboxylase